MKQRFCSRQYKRTIVCIPIWNENDGFVFCTKLHIFKTVVCLYRNLRKNHANNSFPYNLTKADMLYNTPAASQAGILPHYILFLIVPIPRLAPVPCYV